MLTYRTAAAGSLSRGKAMANHLLEQTLPAEAAEFARYYQNGLRAASPEEQMLRALARAVTKGFLDFEDAVGSLLESSAGRLAVSQPASARADTEALLRSLGRAVAENLLDFETAVEVIAERQLDDLKAEPASAHAQLGRLFATGEIRAADLEPLWFEIEGRQVANTETLRIHSMRSGMRSLTASSPPRTHTPNRKIPPVSRQRIA